MVGTKGIAQKIHTSKCTNSEKTLGIGSEIMFKQANQKLFCSLLLLYLLVTQSAV